MNKNSLNEPKFSTTEQKNSSNDMVEKHLV